MRKYVRKRCPSCKTRFLPEKGQHICGTCRAAHLRDKDRRRYHRRGSQWEKGKSSPKRLAAAHMRAHRYYEQHKEQIAAYIRQYAKRNQDRVKVWNQSAKVNLRLKWSGTLTSTPRGMERERLGKMAEAIVANIILPYLGYTDIYQPRDHFSFDLLAKKGAQISGVEVTTALYRKLKPYTWDLAQYVDWKVMVILVSPTWQYAKVFYPKTKDERCSYAQGQLVEFSIEDTTSIDRNLSSPAD